MKIEKLKTAIAVCLLSLLSFTAIASAMPITNPGINPGINPGTDLGCD